MPCDERVLGDMLDRAVRPLNDRMGTIERLMERQRDKLPARVDEFNEVISDTSCTVHPQAGEGVLVLVQSLFLYSSVGNPTITLGDMVWTETGNRIFLENVGWLLRRNDKRQITAGSAGTLVMRITGVEIPTDRQW